MSRLVGPEGPGCTAATLLLLLRSSAAAALLRSASGFRSPCTSKCVSRVTGRNVVVKFSESDGYNTKSCKFNENGRRRMVLVKLKIEKLLVI